ncbi:acetate kinase [Asticcacaulis biprosthecium C19]|uniref:Acetate kinase n=1 Tax=Asticcacaulis biprosthecium C19 TaxID=715226 RepID=F4QTF7_9CAUL|nr:acetate kinase [Asticcacaulis biprosthecium]EGF90027.1 acetate kinase [Asticcacaulis biprosthecium C19]
MSDALLTLNAGSSSLKFRLFGLQDGLPVLGGGKITGIGGNPALRLAGETDDRPLSRDMDMPDAVAFMLEWLEGHAGCHISAAAHRIVHGGPNLDQCVQLDPSTLDVLKTLIPLAPLHQPHNLAAVDALAESHPGLAQFGCFDTAFHAHRERVATAFALPAHIRDKGVRRYGFHGLSYAWIARRLAIDHPELHGGRVVVAHLGNGASLCAMANGRSVDTTMGLTALDGLPMGTRCGALDPGAVLYMQRELGLSLDDVERLLYQDSGLKGLSGISNDVRDLLESSSPDAIFALDYFARKTAQQIAAMAVSLGGLDGLVFTGGIGENATPVRERILAALAWLPPFRTLVIPADEERAMALDVAPQLSGRSLRLDPDQSSCV